VFITGIVWFLFVVFIWMQERRNNDLLVVGSNTVEFKLKKGIQPPAYQ
jgi:hypothetical protein